MKMESFSDILAHILIHAFLVAVWLGSVAAAIVGAGLLLQPKITFTLNTYLSRWIDTGRIVVALDRSLSSERFLYRHHRFVGALLVCGGVLVLYKFLLTPLSREVALMMTGDIMGLWDAVAAMLIIGNVLAVMFGSIVFFRPSLIRELETAANAWISIDEFLKIVNRSHSSFDRFVMENNQIVGIFLAGGGTYTTVQLGRVLYTGDWSLIV